MKDKALLTLFAISSILSVLFLLLVFPTILFYGIKAEEVFLMFLGAFGILAEISLMTYYFLFEA